MAKTLNMKTFALFFILVPGILSVVCADQKTQENILMKSWGLKINAQGQPKYLQLHKNTAHYESWQPDMSSYRIKEPRKQAHEPLTPVVISATNKPAK